MRKFVVCFGCCAIVWLACESIRFFGSCFTRREFARAPRMISTCYLFGYARWNVIALQELTSRKSFSWLEFAGVIFRRRQATAGSTSAFAGYSPFGSPSFPASSFPLTSVRVTSDPGKIQFEVRKYRTSAELRMPRWQTRGSFETLVFYFCSFPLF